MCLLYTWFTLPQGRAARGCLHMQPSRRSLSSPTGRWSKTTCHIKEHLICFTSMGSHKYYLVPGTRYPGTYMTIKHITAGHKDAELTSWVDWLVPTRLFGTTVMHTCWLGSKAWFSSGRRILDGTLVFVGKLLLLEVRRVLHLFVKHLCFGSHGFAKDTDSVMIRW